MPKTPTPKTPMIKVLIPLALGLLTACGSRQLRIDPAEAWTDLPAEERHDAPVVHRLFFVGDAGNDDHAGVLASVKARLAALSPDEQAASTLLFLGDNVYPEGLPNKDDPYREQAEAILQAQLSLAQGYGGRVIFLPGNHDAMGGGTKSIRRQEDFVEKQLTKLLDADQRVDAFLPTDGCSGPVELELAPELLLVVVNSEWFLTDWDRDPEINERCEIRSRAGFAFAFEQLTRKNRHRRVVVAAHHPPATYGRHGGGFSVADHMWPAPVLGTLVVLGRLGGLVPQDLTHPMYRAYSRVLLQSAKKNGRFVFVGGHEHNQQYLEDRGQAIIVTGSGAKEAPARLGRYSRYKSSNRGFAELSVHEGGAGSVHFYDAAGQLEFATDLPQLDTIVAPPAPQVAAEDDSKPAPVQLHPPLGDPVTAKVSKKKVAAGKGLTGLLMGEHYRWVYQQYLRYPTLDLSEFSGGATVVKAGGGAQTNTLRLVDASGQQWALRATTKDAYRALPYPWGKLHAVRIVTEDFFASTHPHAALVVPTLAQAAGIHHTSPRLVWVPAQPGLGDFSALISDEVALLERRPEEPDSGDLPDSLGGQHKAYSTPQLLDLWKGDPLRHRVDQDKVVQARLFDLVLGDWDRHDDQWRWSRVPDGRTAAGKKRYRYEPIPRDRDQALSNYDGLLISLARGASPTVRQMVPLRRKIRNPLRHSYNGRIFDETFMPAMGCDVWAAQADALQAQLTDDVIDAAIAELPELVAAHDGPEMRAALVRRRDRLDEIALRMCEQVNRVVEVTGSDGRDRFSASYEDGGLRVRIEDVDKDGDSKGVFFERVFDPTLTREIRLYGLDGDDEYVVTGTAPRGGGIRLRLVAGPGRDRFEDRSRTPGLGRTTKVYDTKPKTDQHREDLVAGRETADLRSNLGERHLYYRRDRHYDFDHQFLLPRGGLRPEDSVYLGLSYTVLDHRFKRDPYGARHKLDVDFSSSTYGVDVSYLGDFREVFGRWDAHLLAEVVSPTSTRTWFGQTNQTFQVRDLHFYRVRQEWQRLEPSVSRGWSDDRVTLSMGVLGERTRILEESGRYLLSMDSDVLARVQDSQYFAGGTIGLSANTFDNPALARRGMGVELLARARQDLERTAGTSADLQASMSFHWLLDRGERLVLSTTGAWAQALGSPEFYQLPTLGGGALRAYHQNQLTGESTLVQVTDLRLELFDHIGLAPVTGGLNVGLDHGRVWAPELEGGADTWHINAGGGVWLTVIEQLGISADYFVGPKVDWGREQRFVLEFGPLFRHTPNG